MEKLSNTKVLPKPPKPKPQPTEMGTENYKGYIQRYIHDAIYTHIVIYKVLNYKEYIVIYKKNKPIDKLYTITATTHKE